MMNLLLFGFGIVAGSVANALIYRLPRGISWYKGRSFCPNCKHRLSLFDLIPIFSYLFLRRRCRYCDSPIPIRYLLVELFMGVGFVLSPLSNLGILWITTVIAVMDWETMLVSDWLVAFWAILILVSNFDIRISNLYGILFGIGIIGGIWLITKKKAMGSGDIGIAAVLGLWLGFPKIITALWLAFVIGGIYGAYLLLTKKAKLKTAVPFGPFLILGGWIAYTISNGILSF